MNAWRVLILLVVFAFGTVAQTSLGTIRGVVTDPTGAAVPGADVSVRNMGTNIEHKAQTENNGMYEVTHLIPGRYAVSTAHPGFRTATSAVVLQTSAAVRIDLQLVVGELTTAVDVEATAPPIALHIATPSSIAR